MRRELIAYHHPWFEGVVDVSDLTDRSVEGDPLFCSIAPELVTEPQLAILISIPPCTATQYDWLCDAAKRWESTHVKLPLSITKVSFQRLVDLRVPRVADWFTQNLTRLHWVSDDGIETPAFPRKAPLDQFVQLLPTLALQCLGGGHGATRIAGQWLRSLGADGLVYPSARSNSFVEIRDGNVAAFHGWNVVDYRGADPVRLQTYDQTPAWMEHVANEVDEPPIALYKDVVLQHEGSGSSMGSWSWQNLAQTNIAQRLLFSAAWLYSWAWDGASPAQPRELGSMLGLEISADRVGKTSGALLLALLGNIRIRGALLKWASEGFSPEESQLLDLAGTFDRIDARIAAGKGGRFGKRDR